jgi:S-methylmethionine-dependent homocysteine/selenocysteine methylase
MRLSYRKALPQLDGSLFVTDGGIETSLIFNDGLALPDFAAFHLLKTEDGTAALRRYYGAYAAIARRFRTGLVLESATWRASADWGERLGYTRRELVAANRQAIGLLEEIRAMNPHVTTVISGCLGPRGDGYQPARLMAAAQAADYHREQIDALAGAEMVSAITMNYAEEALGIARAARDAAIPVAISFTVETDGRLPTGQPLGEAIEEVDAATGFYPAYYMLNCAHPEHFARILRRDAFWITRIRGLRANASRKSHAELNESAELDIGNPAELGAQYAELRQYLLPRMNVVGGCCGTDYRHVEHIAAACSPLFRAAA